MFIVTLASLLGGPWTVPATLAGPASTDSASRLFWSFSPPSKPELPAVRNAEWARTRIDRFVQQRMEEAGLQPAPEAGRAVWLRRVTFDLTGLPPAPKEVANFVGDTAPNAHAKAVDRLLSSPRFGERMASMWLTLARYAEDQAHQVGNDVKHFYPNAFRYRDWLIEAFNRDLPYAQFLERQLAADLIEPDSDELPALGFLGLGPRYYNRGRLEVMADEWEDKVDTVSRTFLGLTVACARCHDHKFDPISTEDYHAMAGIFASVEMVNQPLPGLSESEQKEATEKNTHTLHIVRDGKPRDLNVFVRGDVTRKGALIERRFLEALTPPGADPTPFREGSGRRALADALVDPANPLTARVMVNRLWGTFFGDPLVATPSNFGTTGEPPSHPALLDDLAFRFVENGWSMKSVIREFVLSATYRQDSAPSAAATRVDPANRWLSHMPRKRLPIEMWRDALLAVTAAAADSGCFSLVGGPSVEVSSPNNFRRTLYSRISRLELDGLLARFDYPDPNVHAAGRATTISPTQKLFALNSPFIMARADALARALTRDPDEAISNRIRRAYSLLFARSPDPKELSIGIDFLSTPAAAETLDRWTTYAHALLASNEMMYLD